MKSNALLIVAIFCLAFAEGADTSDSSSPKPYEDCPNCMAVVEKLLYLNKNLSAVGIDVFNLSVPCGLVKENIDICYKVYDDIDRNTTCISCAAYTACATEDYCKPNGTTTTPKTTTKHPKITTKHPKITTKHPKITTKHPKVTTKHPKVTTKHPKITTKHPKNTTGNPKTTKGNLKHTTGHPKPTTAHPKSTTKGHPKPTTGHPKNTTGHPKPTTAHPKNTTGHPKPTTAHPKSTTKGHPKLTTAHPKSTTKGHPKPTTAHPKNTTGHPKPTTAHPKSTTHKSSPTLKPKTTTKILVHSRKTKAYRLHLAANKGSHMHFKDAENSTKCYSCEHVMYSFREETRHYNKDKIKKSLTSMCNEQDKKYKAYCLQLIKTDADLMVNMLYNRLPSPVMCNKLKQCSFPYCEPCVGYTTALKDNPKLHSDSFCKNSTTKSGCIRALNEGSQILSKLAAATRDDFSARDICFSTEFCPDPEDHTKTEDDDEYFFYG